MQIVPFAPAHLAALRLQPAQAFLGPALTDPGYAERVAKFEAYTAIADGQVIAVAGLADSGNGSAQAACILGADSGKHFVRIMRAIDRQIRASRFKRIFSLVPADFTPAHRWSRILGFAPVVPSEQHLQDGRSYQLYTRVNHG